MISSRSEAWRSQSACEASLEREALLQAKLACGACSPEPRFLSSEWPERVGPWAPRRLSEAKDDRSEGAYEWRSRRAKEAGWGAASPQHTSHRPRLRGTRSRGRWELGSELANVREWTRYEERVSSEWPNVRKLTPHPSGRAKPGPTQPQPQLVAEELCWIWGNHILELFSVD